MVSTYEFAGALRYKKLQGWFSDEWIEQKQWS